MEINRRQFLKLLSVGAGTACLPLNAGKTFFGKKRPNIIIIVADDMGYNGSSVFGGWIETPALKKMSDEGITFTNFHSSGSMCTPTRAGLLTGRYQGRTGIGNVIQAAPHKTHEDGLQPTEITFSKRLKESGYKTGMTGKWHLGHMKKYHPFVHGFDSFHGFLGGNIDYISHINESNHLDWYNGYTLKNEEGYTTHLINKYANQFIEKNAGDPFLLYISHAAPHKPFQGPGDPMQRGSEEGLKAAKKMKGEQKQKAYQEMIEEMDKGIGQVFDLLKKHKIDDNTFVFFFSDNGPSFGGPEGYVPPFRGHKGNVWEGGHRVPAVVRFPSMIKKKIKTDEQVISLDIMPTILELADVKVSEGHLLDGLSLIPFFRDSKPLGKRKFFWKNWAMTDGDWKLVTRDKDYKEKKPLLFNLKDDIREENDISDQYPEKVKQMLKEMKAFKKDIMNTATPQPSKMKKKNN
jgi:arylsulfatase A-like enzyme